MGRLSYPTMKSLDFAIMGINFVTLKDIKYGDIIVPKGYVFDGVTAKAPFTFIFSTKDLRQGIRASCIHDWMCEHRSQYTREYSTKVLVDIWKEDGLNGYKAFIAKISVNVYQFFRGGWKE